MQQYIKYSGLAAIPDDYLAPDGQLDIAINLLNEDGAMKPLAQPTTVFSLSNTAAAVVYIHKTSAFTHYIIQRSNILFWIDADAIAPGEVINPDGCPQIHDFYPDNIHKIVAIGNTLMVLTSGGVHYAHWKDDNNNYKYLGNHLPELSLSFGLQANQVLDDEMTVEIPSEYQDTYISRQDVLDGRINFATRTESFVSNYVLAKVNKFIAEKSTNDGKFIFPFFVRYAYRMFDGSLTMHSAPVLMVTSSKIVTPQAFFRNTFAVPIERIGPLVSFKVQVGACVCELDCQCIDGKSALKEWEDIITSVDVFISAPLYAYDQSGSVSGIALYTSERYGYSVSALQNTVYAKRNLRIAPEIPYNEQMWEYQLPQFSNERISENIRSCANFYLLHSWSIDNLPDSRTKIDIPSDYLRSLTSRELMTDDYDSHDLLIPTQAFVYNSRLNIANVSKNFSTPATLAACVPFTNEYFSENTQNGSCVYSVYVLIKKDGKTFVRKTTLTSILGDNYPVVFFYYPNPNAYRAVINKYDVDNNTHYRYYLELKPHDFLNGAVYFNGWQPVVPVHITTGAQDITNADDLNAIEAQYQQAVDNENIVIQIDNESPTDTVSLPNKIYTSEINNPFHFQVTGISTVGAGIIIGLSSATQALSQGQFGQFPLYAFCSDGVWALSVSDTGSFSAVQPVTRDVCTNPDAITSLDNSVLFTTDRGIMQLSGSNAVCISDIIATEHPFNHLSQLPKLSQVAPFIFRLSSFSNFLSGCRMLYDYIHQRIIVYNQTVSYAYVFSLRSKLWGMMQSNLASSLNSYPDALAMDQAASLVSFSQHDSPSGSVDAIAVTRPVKFDSPDTLKSIHTLIQRGVFARGDVKTVLYGSRDLSSWHLVASSVDHYLRGLRGTPYKYFRIVAITSLTDNKSLAGATVDVETRHVHRLH